MNKLQQKPNPAKNYLSGYRKAKEKRRYLLSSGPEAIEVHGKDIEEQTAIMRDVLAMISKLEDSGQVAVMLMRYVNCWPWSKIIFEMGRKGYSERVCYVLHGRALQKLNATMMIDR